jgi:hypothetical protein
MSIETVQLKSATDSAPNSSSYRYFKILECTNLQIRVYQYSYASHASEFESQAAKQRAPHGGKLCLTGLVADPIPPAQRQNSATAQTISSRTSGVLSLY